MTDRLSLLLNELPACESFADVGCDHGIIAEKMLLRGGLKRLVVSDISGESLKKAQRRLNKYAPGGSCEKLSGGAEILPVVCDGLALVPLCECVLIAGMGGEEIIKILTNAPFLPEFLVLQPMKNVQKLRKYVLALGYGIKKDYVFKDKKFYDVLVCEKGAECKPYSDTELEFGRDNLKNYSPAFIEYVKIELQKAKKYAKNVVSLCDLAAFNQRITLLTEILKGAY